MNFAENQKWHPSLLWRAGPAKMLGGLMREGSDGRPEVGQPASVLDWQALLISSTYLILQIPTAWLLGQACRLRSR